MVPSRQKSDKEIDEIDINGITVTPVLILSG